MNTVFTVFCSPPDLGSDDIVALGVALEYVVGVGVVVVVDAPETVTVALSFEEH